jgi:hypothetical protein
VWTKPAQSGVWVPGRAAANSATTRFLPALSTPFTVKPWIVGTTKHALPTVAATFFKLSAKISGYSGSSLVPASKTITESEGS